MHITEFNTSYTPLNPIHDTNLNAAYVARLLSEMGDMCASYSYWTFGDVFEEAGVAFTPFSGCFGLLTNGMIPKPTYWTYSFFNNLTSNAIARNEHMVITKDEESNIYGVTWNPVEDNKQADITLNLSIHLENGEYMLVTRLVDEDTCNPLKTWIHMGSPANLSKEQLELIKESARPLIKTFRFQIDDYAKDLEITLSSNAVLYFEIKRIFPTLDRGFLPERIQGAR